MNFNETLNLMRNAQTIEFLEPHPGGPYVMSGLSSTVYQQQYIITDVNDDEESYGGMVAYLDSDTHNTAISIAELSSILPNDKIVIE